MKVPVVEDVALSWVALRGVPETMEAGLFQVMVGVVGITGVGVAPAQSTAPAEGGDGLGLPFKSVVRPAIGRP